MKDHYVLQYPTGGYVGLSKTGLTPFETEYPGFVFYWADQKLAEDFAKENRKLKLAVKQVEFTFF